MATGTYQIGSTPRLYVSYPLFAYAMGGLGAAYSSNENLTDEDLYRMIQLDPANYTEIDITNFPQTEFNDFNYKCVSNKFAWDSQNLDWWNFNYAMVLGHNIASANGRIAVQSAQTYSLDNIPTQQNALLNSNVTSIQNYIDDQSDVPYDGWSAFELSHVPDPSTQWMGIMIAKLGEQFLTNKLKIGSILWGKFWDAPQNVQLSTSVSYSYGNKSKTTTSGKSLSNIEWSKPNAWVDGNEPFGLTHPTEDENVGDHFGRRTGRRSWKMSWTSMDGKYIMNQNPMLNSHGWNKKDNYTINADNTSTHTIQDSSNNDNSLGDFYTDVIHKTLNGALPMVLCLDKSDPSPSNMAIVKLGKDFTVTQSSPTLYSFQITLIEQI